MNAIARCIQDGLEIVISDGGKENTTRYLAWTAHRGKDSDFGVLDATVLRSGNKIFVATKWTPESASVEFVRDSTPGVRQFHESVIPPGMCELVFYADIPFEVPLDVFISPTGHPGDARSITQARCGRGGSVSLPLVSNCSWKKLFLKKSSTVREFLSISNIEIFHMASGERYESLAHLIKPEHKLLEKRGKASIVWNADAPQYSYFSIGFQLAA